MSVTAQDECSSSAFTWFSSPLCRSVWLSTNTCISGSLLTQWALTRSWEAHGKTPRGMYRLSCSNTPQYSASVAPGQLGIERHVGALMLNAHDGSRGNSSAFAFLQISHDESAGTFIAPPPMKLTCCLYQLHGVNALDV